MRGPWNVCEVRRELISINKYNEETEQFKRNELKTHCKTLASQTHYLNGRERHKECEEREGQHVDVQRTNPPK
jgi:hypothetical protein